MDLASTKSPEYLALNPNGTVPLLVDGDFVLSQNVAILYYLADRNPDAHLLGDDTSHGRAEVLCWLCFLNSDVHPAFKPIFKPSRFVLLRWTIRLEVDSSGLDNLARFLARMYADARVRAAVIAEEGSIDGQARLRS